MVVDIPFRPLNSMETGFESTPSHAHVHGSFEIRHTKGSPFDHSNFTQLTER